MSNEIINKTAEALSNLRSIKGATQEDVAAAIGVSNKTVSKWETAMYIPDHIISDFGRSTRNAVSDDNAFAIMINREAVNMELMLLGNRNNFDWITKNADEFRPLFELLAEPEGLMFVKLIHTKAFPVKFTSDFLANQMGISIEKADRILERAAALRRCESQTAHLKEGTTKIYTAWGDGMVLSMITLAYEFVCGPKCYDYYMGESVKMIRGEE